MTLKKNKKKGVFQVFLRLICLEPILVFFKAHLFRAHFGLFKAHLFKSPFLLDSDVLSLLFFGLSVLRPFSTKVTSYYKPTNQVSVARRQQTKLNQKRGQFPFCRHPIKADSTTWAPIGSAKGHMGSHGS